MEAKRLPWNISDRARASLYSFTFSSAAERNGAARTSGGGGAGGCDGRSRGDEIRS